MDGWPVRIGGIVAVAILFSAPAGAQDRGLTVGEDADSVPADRVRVALRATARRQPDDSLFFRAPHLMADLGVSSWAELGAEWDLRAINGDGDFDDSGVEVGDPIWRVKIVPWHPDGWAVGGVAAFKIPSASGTEGVGTDNADAHLRAFVERQWGHWRAGLTAGAVVQGNPFRRAAAEAFPMGSLWIRYDFDDAWSLAAEVHGTAGPRDSDNVAEGWVGRDRLSARIAGEHRWDDWSLSAGVESGLTDDAPDWEVFVEVARTWGAFDRGIPQTEAEGSRQEERAWLDPLPVRAADPLPAGAYALAFEVEAREQHDGSELYSAPRVGTAFALGDRADLRWWADYRFLHDSDEFGDDDSGFGDLFVEVRWVPIMRSDWSAGLLLGGKVPLSRRAHGTTTGEVDVYTKVLFTLPLGSVRIHGNAGIAVNDNPGRRSRQIDALLWGVAVDVPLAERWRLVAGVDGSAAHHAVDHIAEGWAGARMASARVALQGYWPGSDSVAITLAGAAGIAEQSPDWEALLGFTVWLGR